MLIIIHIIFFLLKCVVNKYVSQDLNIHEPYEMKIFLAFILYFL